MKPVISIGTQDFKKVRKNNAFYVDKSDFIKEWWENRDDVTLITRPRRFGKTLNISMLKYFFSNQYEGRTDLFEGLSIWRDPAYHSLQGSYPVIFLSFADIKGTTFEVARSSIIQKLVKLYSIHSYIKSDAILRVEDWEYIKTVKTDMTDDVAAITVNYLSDYLNRYFGKKVLIFLDEYDTPLQEAYIHGYWNELSAFIRSLFNATFKTNDSLERALLTGITRVGKESIFSDINNLEVVTTTSEKYAAAFGFTQEEVSAALDTFELSANLEKVQFWYDGFRFGSQRDIYNPWSITKYLDNRKFAAYWANTSSNSLVGTLIMQGTPDVKIAVEDLLNDKPLVTTLDEEIIFSQLDESSEAIWSLLLASGYLRADHISNEEEEPLYHLSLTNLEVKKEFRKMIRRWFKKPSVRYNDFIKALIADDIDYMNQYMNQITETVFSSFDTGNHPSDKTEPERFYHGFVLGLIVDSGIHYLVTSNRESGLGRYDVVMEPVDKNENAYVFEFKVFTPGREKTLEDTLKAAHTQIQRKNYDAALIARGIPKQRIRHYGFAFQGKKVLIG